MTSRAGSKITNKRLKSMARLITNREINSAILFITNKKKIQP